MWALQEDDCKFGCRAEKVREETSAREMFRWGSQGASAKKTRRGACNKQMIGGVKEKRAVPWNAGQLNNMGCIAGYLACDVQVYKICW